MEVKIIDEHTAEVSEQKTVEEKRIVDIDELRKLKKFYEDNLKSVSDILEAIDDRTSPA